MVNDPVVMTIVDYCNQLSELMMSWDEQKQEGVKGHPKDCVQIGVRETIVKWLSSKQAVSTRLAIRLDTCIWATTGVVLSISLIDLDIVYWM